MTLKLTITSPFQLRLNILLFFIFEHVNVHPDRQTYLPFLNHGVGWNRLNG